MVAAITQLIVIQESKEKRVRLFRTIPKANLLGTHDNI